MRDASLASCTALCAAKPLATSYGNAGLWSAFLMFVIARALPLGAYYPGLRRSIPNPDPLNAAGEALEGCSCT